MFFNFKTTKIHFKNRNLACTGNYIFRTSGKEVGIRMTFLFLQIFVICSLAETVLAVFSTFNCD